MKTCCKCGQELPDTANFCLQCGAPQNEGASDCASAGGAKQEGGCPFCARVEKVKAWFKNSGFKKAAEDVEGSPEAASLKTGFEKAKEIATPYLKAAGAAVKEKLDKALNSVAESINQAKDAPSDGEGGETGKGKSWLNTAVRNARSAADTAKTAWTQVREAAEKMRKGGKG